jgi:DNA-binding protein H-NS
MNNTEKNKQETSRGTWSAMKRLTELGHQSLSTDEILEVIMELFQVILSKENETRQSKEKAIKMLANSLGYGTNFTSDSLIKQKVTPKYRNPSNPSETWTGRGNKPMWVQNHLDLGGKKEDLKI